MSNARTRKPSTVLPKGAKGIQINDYVVEFRFDKAMVIKRTTDEHFTLHAGDKSGVLDIHRTWRDSEGCEHHESIFAMRREDIPSVLSCLNSFPSDLMELVRPLRLGWLRRRQIGIQWNVLPIEDSQILAVTRPGRKKRLVFDLREFESQVYVPEYLEEIWDMPDGIFTLSKRGRILGVGMKVSEAGRYAQLRWIQTRDLSRLVASLEERVIKIASQCAISPDEYHMYPFLRRKRP